MAVRQNGYFNDPTIGAAFSNLAAAFAPPSAQDSLAYAAAGAKRAEASRLAELYAVAKSGGMSQEQFDRLAVGGGLYTPNQSYYSVDQSNTTARRGQDLTLRGSMHGTDVGARTSITNNEADNARALSDRRMQEEAAMARLGVTDATARRGQDVNASTDLEKQRLADTAKVTGDMLAPVAAGATRFVPPGLAAMYSVDPTQVGTINAGQGDTVVAPDGRTIMGAAKPLTAAEVEGAERQRLAASGQLTDQMLIDGIIGKETPVMAVGPDGKTPAYMTPGAATRTAAQPYIKPTAEREQLSNYATPDGKTGTAVYDGGSGGWRDTQTGQPVPAGSKTFNASLQGDAAGTGLVKTTEAQDKNAYAVTMAEGASKRIDEAFASGKLPTSGDYLGFAMQRKLPMAMAPAVVGTMSDAGQAFYQDVRIALPYQLMSQSGQAVTEQEYERKLLELIPVPNEAPAVTAAKREQFQNYVKAAKGVAGPSYDKIHARGGIPVPGSDSVSTPAPAVDMPSPKSAAEFQQLPSGTRFKAPDGSVRVKP